MREKILYVFLNFKLLWFVHMAMCKTIVVYDIYCTSCYLKLQTQPSSKSELSYIPNKQLETSLIFLFTSFTEKAQSTSLSAKHVIVSSPGSGLVLPASSINRVLELLVITRAFPYFCSSIYLFDQN